MNRSDLLLLALAQQATQVADTAIECVAFGLECANTSKTASNEQDLVNVLLSMRATVNLLLAEDVLLAVKDEAEAQARLPAIEAYIVRGLRRAASRLEN